MANDGTITFTPTVPYYQSDRSATNLVAYYPAATSLASGVASVSITVSDANTTFDMALADGTLSNWAVPSTINAMTNGTATIAGSALTAGIMLEPGLSSIDLKVSATGYPTQTITISGTDGGKFIQGNSYEITLTFKGTSIDFSAEIAAWNPGTGGNGDVQYKQLNVQYSSL